jgi:hypothetical protein
MAASLVVVFSGFRDDSLKTQIESELNGRVVSALSKQVTHLIIKENGKTSKKVDEAKEAGVTVVFLKDFIVEHGLTLSEKPKVKKSKKDIEDVQVVESADEAEPKLAHTESDVNKALIEVIQEETHIQKSSKKNDEIPKESIELPKKKPTVKKSKKTPTEEHVEVPIEVPIELPIEVPVDLPVELPIDVPNELPKKKPTVKKSKKTPTEEPIELPVEVPKELPKKKLTVKKSKKETEVTALKLEIEAAKKHLAELEAKLVEISA